MSYQYRILRDKPLGAWPFDTPASTIPDVSGYARNGTLASRTNLMTNPSFETNTTGWSIMDIVMGASVTRVVHDTPNLVLNPRADSDTTNISAASSDGGAVSVTRVTNLDAPMSADGVLFSAAANASRTYQYGSVALATSGRPLAGETWTLSLWAKWDGVSTANAIRIALCDGSTANNVSGNSPTVTLTTSWQKISYTFVASANSPSTNVFYIGITNGSGSVGFWATNFQLEKGAAVSPSTDVDGSASLRVTSGAYTSESVAPSTEYVASAYVFPTATGVYGIYSASSPAPATEATIRRYGLVANGPGPIVEEAGRNLLTNPDINRNWGMNTTSANATLVFDTSNVLIGSVAARVTVVTSGTWGLNNYTTNYADMVPVKAGKQYTASIWVYHRASTNKNVTMQTRYRNPDLTTNTDYSGTTISVPPNEWTRVTHTTTCPSSAAYAFIQVNVTANAGDVWWADCPQFEEGPCATSYIDGNLGSGYTWEAANNLIVNPSIETSTGSWSGGGQNNSTFTQDSTQHFDGSYSLKVTATNGADFAANPGVNSLASVSAGTSVTFSAYVYIPASGGPTSGVTVGLFGSALTSSVYASYKATTTGSWQRLVVTATAAQAGSISPTIVASGNTLAGAVFYVDAAQAETKSTATPYGSTGAANLTTSTRPAGALQFTTSAPAGAMTLVATYRVPSVGTIRGIAEANDGGSTNRFAIYVDSDSALRGVSGNTGYHLSTTKVNPGDILRAVWVSDNAGNATMYYTINGGAVISQSFTGVATNSATLTKMYIGCLLTGTYQAGGPVENVVLLSRALSSTEASNYLSGTTLPSTLAKDANSRFSAFINDAPATTSLTAGVWTRISQTKTTLPSESRDDVIVIAHSTRNPFYVDAAIFQTGGVPSSYFSGTTTVMPPKVQPIVSGGGAALNLASSDSVTFPITEIMAAGRETQPFSLEAWIKSKDTLDYGWIFQRNNAGLKIEGDDVVFYLPFANGTKSARWTNGLAVGDPTHLVAVYDTTQMYLYVDGEVVAATDIYPDDISAGWTSETANVLTMTAYGQYSMTVDTPAVYPYALSKNTIQAHNNYGTNFRDVVRMTGFNGANIFKFSDAQAIVRAKAIIDDATSWATGAISGSLAVVNDALVNQWSDTTSQYESGSWLYRLSVDAYAPLGTGTRTNYISNPSFENGLTGYSLTNGSNVSIVDSPSGVGSAVQLAPDATNADVRIYSTDFFPCVNGDKVTLAFDYTKVAGTSNLFYGIEFSTSSKGYISGLYASTPTGTSSGRIVYTGTCNQATAAYARIVVYTNTSGVAGDIHIVDNITAEKGMTDGSYFDGFSPLTQWTGEANNSSSVYTTLLEGSRISWSANQQITVSTSVDGGTTYTAQNNNGQPVGAIDISGGQDIIVKVDIAAGSVQTVVDYLSLTLYHAKDVTLTNEDVAATMQSPLNATLSEYDYNPAEFDDRDGVLLSGGATGITVPADNSLGSYAAVEFTVSPVSLNAGNVLLYVGTASNQPQVYVDTNGKIAFSNLTALYIDGVSVTSGTTMAAGHWRHMIAVFSATKSMVYLGNNSSLNSGTNMRVGYLACHVNAISATQAAAMYSAWSGAAPTRYTEANMVNIKEHTFPDGAVAAHGYAHAWSQQGTG